MSKVANVVGRLKKEKQHMLILISTIITNPAPTPTIQRLVDLPWFHENTTKMDLSVQINIQHLFKVVLKNTLKLQTNI